MPRRQAAFDDYTSAVPQIIIASTDSDFLDHLIPVLKDAAHSRRIPALIQCLTRYSEDREADIERIGLTKHEEFLDSVSRLQHVREDTVSLTTEILKLNQSIQASTEKLAEQKGALVNTKAIRQNIADATEALRDSLKVLHAVNHAHDLIRQKNYYSALKSLEDLQNEYLVPILQNRYATQHRLADVIQKSIPGSRKGISEAVMTDLNTWLFRVRETSQFLGEVAFYHTEMRRSRQRKRVEDDQFLANFKLNSSIELVCDESEEFDVLDNEELQVNFTPLFEALHIHDALGQSDRFRAEYAATRRQQKDLLLPSTIELLTDDESSLSSLLEGIAGFSIIEKETMRRVPQLRSAAEVEELWESMCGAAISLTSRALNDVGNAEVLLKIKGFIALFVQTMEGWGYSISTLDTFLLTLFDKYAELLKHRFSEDFQEIVSTDDYMPMAINSREEYEKVINVSWFMQSQAIDDVTQSLDELLTEKVCRLLVERLSSQYLGQIVQILINLEHFEIACQELEQLLIRARSSSSAGGPLKLNATEEFRNNKKTAEKRIFELVNSKIDDLVDTAEYDCLENGQMLRENLDELQQTVNLMESDNHDEFFDISIRNKKYGRVDALNGPVLLEKCVV
ncbi:exocyst complex, sec15 subunit [Metarhizium anisopliae]|nr:exocyst complex, sec15 subunit [Metarhizium anisopliae]